MAAAASANVIEECCDSAQERVIVIPPKSSTPTENHHHHHHNDNGTGTNTGGSGDGIAEGNRPTSSGKKKKGRAHGVVVVSLPQVDVGVTTTSSGLHIRKPNWVPLKEQPGPAPYKPQHTPHSHPATRGGARPHTGHRQQSQAAEAVPAAVEQASQVPQKTQGSAASAPATASIPAQASEVSGVPDTASKGEAREQGHGTHAEAIGSVSSAQQKQEEGQQGAGSTGTPAAEVGAQQGPGSEQKDQRVRSTSGAGARRFPGGQRGGREYGGVRYSGYRPAPSAMANGQTNSPVAVQQAQGQAQPSPSLQQQQQQQGSQMLNTSGGGLPRGATRYPSKQYYQQQWYGGQAQQPGMTYYMDRDYVRIYLQQKLEYYLSKENMIKDWFLRRNMNGEGWIPLDVIANFKTVVTYVVDSTILVEAAQLSPAMELNGILVRPATFDWHEVLLPEHMRIQFNPQAPQAAAAVADGAANY